MSITESIWGDSVMGKKHFLLSGALIAVCISLASCAMEQGWADSAHMEDRSVPMLMCEGEASRQEVLAAEWNLSTNEIVKQSEAVGTTTDWFELETLRWDGEETVFCPEYLLRHNIFAFQENMSVIPVYQNMMLDKNAGIYLSSDGNYIETADNRIPFVMDLNLEEYDLEYANLVEDVGIGGIGLLSMLSSDKWLYILHTPNVMTEQGLFLFCTAVNLESSECITRLIDETPFSFEHINITYLDPNNFGTDGDRFYFAASDRVYQIDPLTAVSSVFVPITEVAQAESLEYFDSLWANENQIILETSTVSGDEAGIRSYHAFTKAGVHIATCRNVSPCAFPKL